MNRYESCNKTRINESIKSISLARYFLSRIFTRPCSKNTRNFIAALMLCVLIMKKMSPAAQMPPQAHIATDSYEHTKIDKETSKTARTLQHN